MERFHELGASPWPSSALMADQYTKQFRGLMPTVNSLLPQLEKFDRVESVAKVFLKRFSGPDRAWLGRAASRSRSRQKRRGQKSSR